MPPPIAQILLPLVGLVGPLPVLLGLPGTWLAVLAWLTPTIAVIA
ncbi:MAG: hypothetical protein R3F49_20685 [Planctomycetota bacterium]